MITEARPCITFAAITDIHFGPPDIRSGVIGKLTHLAHGLTTEIVNSLNSVGVELVLQLGDLIQDDSYASDKSNYLEGVAVLSALEAPIYHSFGNHDVENLSLDDLLIMTNQKTPYYSFDAGGYHFIGLHSQLSNPPSIESSIDEGQVFWLREDLNNNFLPTVVFTHYSLADLDISKNPWFSGKPKDCLVSNRREIRQLLSDDGNVILVLNGHLHENQCRIHDRIPYITLQSVTENYSDRGVPAAAYSVIRIDHQKLVVEVMGNDYRLYEFTSYGASDI